MDAIRSKQGLIVSDRRVRMVGTPFAPADGQAKAEAVKAIDAAEDKRRRRAERRMEIANGK